MMGNEELIKAVRERAKSLEFGLRAIVLELCMRLERHLAIDAAPVVHGRWIPCDPDGDVRFYCSQCDTEISTSWDYDQDEMWNYCPSCGAKMDLEVET